MCIQFNVEIYIQFNVEKCIQSDVEIYSIAGQNIFNRRSKYIQSNDQYILSPW